MKGQRIKILYLDDEINNLNAFKATFRRNYEIYTAISSQEAKQILKDIEVQIIIADQRMPGMTGVEFYNSVKEIYPDPIRILLTGYTDIEALIDSINKGEIYRFIKKPWDEFELQNAIQNAFEIFSARQLIKEKIAMLEKSNDELSRFIYSASHDLRSPLMSVLGIINLAKLDNSITDPQGYMNMIEESIIRLDVFIQNIIEYYKNSRLEPEIDTIEFNSLIQDSVNQGRHQNSSIKFDIQVNQPNPFRGDSFRIGIILNNLISNAIKYQKPEEKNQTVAITALVDPHRALLTIQDNGIGILNEHLNNIFKMFFRTNNSNKPGTGIGLYIVKEALTRIGGTISVTSELGKGTKFEIHIPNHNDPSGRVENTPG